MSGSFLVVPSRVIPERGFALVTGFFLGLVSLPDTIFWL